MIAYYSVTADRDFWREHWGSHSVEELLAIARTSPLSELVCAALPPGGLVLEAGCGLGQYVLLLRERGWRVVGVDWGVEALAAGRRARPAPLAAMALTALALRDGAVSAYVSLGVVEHDPAGPDAILTEARRVLAPGGTLVISVPYVNGLRRLAAPWLRRQGRALAAAGGAFYQYAFSRREFLGRLAHHGFTRLAASPYDPARILRGVLPRRVRGGRPGDAPGSGEDHGSRRRGGMPVALLRRALYTGPALRLCGHMLLVVARRQ